MGSDCSRGLFVGGIGKCWFVGVGREEIGLLARLWRVWRWFLCGFLASGRRIS